MNSRENRGDSYDRGMGEGFPRHHASETPSIIDRLRAANTGKSSASGSGITNPFWSAPEYDLHPESVGNERSDYQHDWRVKQLRSDLLKSRQDVQNMQLAVLFSENLSMPSRKAFFDDFFLKFEDPLTRKNAFFLSTGLDPVDYATQILNMNSDKPEPRSQQDVNQKPFSSQGGGTLQGDAASQTESERTTNTRHSSVFAQDGSVQGSDDFSLPSFNRSHRSRLNPSADTGTRQEILNAGQGQALPNDTPWKTNAVFETLKQLIYREVAAFIACNENGPHFLLRLFRILQGLTSDYLKESAIQSLEELVDVHQSYYRTTGDESFIDLNGPRDQNAGIPNRLPPSTGRLASSTVVQKPFGAGTDAYKTEDRTSKEESARRRPLAVSGSASNLSTMSLLTRLMATSSEVTTTEDDDDDNANYGTDDGLTNSDADDHGVPRREAQRVERNSLNYDYEESVISGSGVEDSSGITPGATSSETSSVRGGEDGLQEDAPFASDPLRDTVLHYGVSPFAEAIASLDHVRQRNSNLGDVVMSEADTETEGEDDEMFAHSPNMRDEFHEEIENNKNIVLALSSYLNQLDPSCARCSEKIIGEAANLVADLAANCNNGVGLEHDNTGSTGQLCMAVRETLLKFAGHNIQDESEDVLRAVSDILYDEMIFNKVMKQVDRSYQEEISDLKQRQSSLDNSVQLLHQQRNEDIEKLQRERWQRLRKEGGREKNRQVSIVASGTDSADLSENLLNARDDAMAGACEYPREREEEIPNTHVSPAKVSPTNLALAHLEQMDQVNPAGALAVEDLMVTPLSPGLREKKE